MKFEEIKKLVEYYEDYVIVNFENHFSNLVLNDFYEGGYNDRIEDEFYYEEYFSDFEDGIIESLLQIEDEQSDEYYDLKLRLIKMKRIIDTKLSKVKTELDEDKSSRTIRRNKQFLINPKIEKEKFIQVLHNQLTINKLIAPDLKSFKSHFDNNWENRTQWFGTELQILNLVLLLINNKYLDPETHGFKHQLIVNHFINKKGQRFKSGQLSSVKSEKIEHIPTDDIIYKIVNEISTHF